MSVIPAHTVRGLCCGSCSRGCSELFRPRIFHCESDRKWEEHFVAAGIENRLVRSLDALQLLTLGDTHIKSESFDFIEEVPSLESWSLDEIREDGERD